MAKKHVLPGEMTIYAAGAARELFRGWVSKLPRGRRGTALEGTALEVESSGVGEVDASGIQLLLALRRTLAASKRDLRLVNPSGTLTSACRSLGVAALLGTGGDAA